MSDPRHTAGLLLLAVMVLALIGGVVGSWRFRKRATRLRAADRRTRKWGIEGDHEPPKV